MGRHDDSLKDIRGRMPVEVFTPNGNYRRSHFPPAYCVHETGGLYEPYEFQVVPSIITSVLLFMNGYPSPEASSSYPFEDQVRPGGQGGAEAIALNGNIEQATHLLITEDAETWIGQQVSGKTATAGVPVKGVFATMSILNRGGWFEGAVPFVKIKAISNSGIINTEVKFNVVNIEEATGFSTQPVLMRQQDYTQDMRDNGDVIRYNLGPLLSEMVIVGLFEEELQELIP